MTKKIEALKQKIADAKAEMKEIGEAAMRESFNDFFKNNPEVEKIIIPAYQKYFNDGDAVSYSVHEPQVILTRATFDAKLAGKAFGKYIKFEEGDQAYQNFMENDAQEFFYSVEHYKDARLIEVAENLQVLINVYSNKDLFMSMFGDHIKVVLTPNSIDVEDYTDHE